MNKLCKFYVNGHCKKGRDCDFEHRDRVCRDYFNNGSCNRKECNFEHVKGPIRRDIKNTRYVSKQGRIHSKKRKKNTETFEPNHEATDMRIIVASGKDIQYNRIYLSRDVIYVPDLFGDVKDLSIYQNLLQEIKNSGVKEIDIWKSWHGDRHLIADDKKKWKSECPTFNMVIQKIQKYFKMDIKATRLNWYRNSSEWKPFHHDAAAMKPDKAKTQNITVGVSFGEEREAAFQHAKSYTTISLPLPNNSIYVFNRDTNIIWRHGILQEKPEKYSDKGRISIIAWGWVNMIDS